MGRKTSKKKCDDEVPDELFVIYYICLAKNMNISAIFMSPTDRREAFGKVKLKEKETLDFIKKYLDI